MSIKRFFKVILVCGVLAVFTLQSCMQPAETSNREISSLLADTTVLLKENSQESPTCHIKINFAYLLAESKNDSIARHINRTLQRVAFGNKYETTTLENVIMDVENGYITNYRKDLLPYYEEDIKKGLGKEEIPPMYMYEYGISSELKNVHDSIYTYSVVSYEYTGGAHPNTYLNWININANSGKELKKEDVFKNGCEKQLVSLIGKQLLAEVNSRLRTDTITSMQGLWENGVLLDVDLYVPENFLITDEGIKFLYNRYEIAPYVMGDFQLTVPYEEIKKFIKL